MRRTTSTTTLTQRELDDNYKKDIMEYWATIAAYLHKKENKRIVDKLYDTHCARTIGQPKLEKVTPQHLRTPTICSLNPDTSYELVFSFGRTSVPATTETIQKT